MMKKRIKISIGLSLVNYLYLTKKCLKCSRLNNNHLLFEIMNNK